MNKEHAELIAQLREDAVSGIDPKMHVYGQHLCNEAAAALESLDKRVRELEDDARDHHTALQSALFTTPATSDEVASLVRVLRERGQKIEWDGDDVSADQQLLHAADVIERLDRERQELRQWQRDMVAKAADKSLAGYRELGAKCAALEDRAERAEAERDAVLRGQRRLMDQTVRIRNAALRDEERPGVDTEQIVNELRDERDAAMLDARRFDWCFSDCNKIRFLNQYLEGIRDHWTVDQWRAAIDVAIAGEGKG